MIYRIKQLICQICQKLKVATPFLTVVSLLFQVNFLKKPRFINFFRKHPLKKVVKFVVKITKRSKWNEFACRFHHTSVACHPVTHALVQWKTWPVEVHTMTGITGKIRFFYFNNYWQIGRRDRGWFADQRAEFRALSHPQAAAFCVKTRARIRAQAKGRTC